jgi:hypothetical protein
MGRLSNSWSFIFMSKYLPQSPLWRRTAVAAAAGLLLAAGAVHAQQSAGSINVRASKGASIVIENKSIGVSRQLKANDDGAAQVSQLPSGTYTVTVINANGSQDTKTVEVQAGQGSDAYFGSLQTVVVTGTANRSLRNPLNQPDDQATIDRIPVTDVCSTCWLGALKRRPYRSNRLARWQRTIPRWRIPC